MPARPTPPLPRRDPRLAACLLACAATLPAAADFTGWSTERVDRDGLARISVYANFSHPLDRLELVSQLTLVEGSPVFHHRDAITQGADSTTAGSWDPNFVLAPDAMDSYLMLGGGTGFASANGTIADQTWGVGSWHVPQIPFGDYLNGPAILLSLPNGQNVAGQAGRVQVGSFVLSPASADAGAILFTVVVFRDGITGISGERRTQFCVGGKCVLPDCDGDGVVDGAEIAFGQSDLDGDALPDICEFARGDLDLDDDTDGADLAILLSSWGPGSGRADINRDFWVNGADLAALLSNWGTH
ncbi:MAG: hypothetical protein ACO3QC_10300 [Phycisphaerales bacterium]